MTSTIGNNYTGWQSINVISGLNKYQSQQMQHSYTTNIDCNGTLATASTTLIHYKYRILHFYTPTMYQITTFTTDMLVTQASQTATTMPMDIQPMFNLMAWQAIFTFFYR